MDMQMERAPERLPTMPRECQTLGEWLELVQGLTQRQVADVAGCKQSRISAIVNGHLPRRAKWPPLLKGFRLEGLESEFYRMVINAKRMAELQQPMQSSHPLLATAQAPEQASIDALVQAKQADILRRAQA